MASNLAVPVAAPPPPPLAPSSISNQQDKRVRASIDKLVSSDPNVQPSPTRRRSSTRATTTNSQGPPATPPFKNRRNSIKSNASDTSGWSSDISPPTTSPEQSRRSSRRASVASEESNDMQVFTITTSPPSPPKPAITTDDDTTGRERLSVEFLNHKADFAAAFNKLQVSKNTLRVGDKLALRRKTTYRPQQTSTFKNRKATFENMGLGVLRVRTHNLCVRAMHNSYLFPTLEHLDNR